MVSLDDLRIQYRRLKTRHLQASEAHRAVRAQELLIEVRDYLQAQGFEVSFTDATIRAVRAARIILLRADDEDEVRIGEFIGFSFVDSQGDGRRRRITAQPGPSALPEHAPIDVDTAESIQAQIAYMEALLAEGARHLQGFEVKETMTMANYREPQSQRDRPAFATLQEAVAYLLARRDPSNGP